MSKNPQLLYVAGPNVAGKSTFSKELSEPGAVIFDVDIVIARVEAQSPGMPKKKVYDTATQEFFNQANAAIKLKQNFTLETNFRDKELMDIASEFKRFGFTTNMVYLTLESVEQSTARVNERVSDGGHFVDRKNILLNFYEGLQYLERFADRFDNLEIIHGLQDPGKFKSLLSIQNHQLVFVSSDLPAAVKQTVNNIADRYRDKSLGENVDNDRDEENDEEQGCGYTPGR